MFWANVALIGGAILTMLGIGAILTKVVQVFFRIGIAKIVDELADMKVQLEQMNTKFDAHMEWHVTPQGRPASRQLPTQRNNGRN